MPQDTETDMNNVMPPMGNINNMPDLISKGNLAQKYGGPSGQVGYGAAPPGALNLAQQQQLNKFSSLQEYDRDQQHKGGNVTGNFEGRSGDLQQLANINSGGTNI